MSKLAEEAIEALDGWSRRLEGHYTEKRQSHRHSCRRKVYIEVPEEAANDLTVGEEGMAEAYLRNISGGGIGFISQQMIPADSVVICLKQDDGQWLKIACNIVRVRTVHNRQWEYGVQFTHKISV